MSKEDAKKLKFFIEKCKKIDGFVEALCKAVSDTHKAHKDLIELLESMEHGGETKSSVPSQNSLLVAKSFQESVPHLRSLQVLGGSIRNTCERAIGWIEAWETSVHETKHYEHKLEKPGLFFGLFESERDLDWLARNEWKLSSAKTSQNTTEQAMAELQEYLGKGVVKETGDCMHAYGNFVAAFAGGVFFDLNVLSGKQKYWLVKDGKSG